MCDLWQSCWSNRDHLSVHWKDHLIQEQSIVALYFLWFSYKQNLHLLHSNRSEVLMPFLDDSICLNCSYILLYISFPGTYSCNLCGSNQVLLHTVGRPNIWIGPLSRKQWIRRRSLQSLLDGKLLSVSCSLHKIRIHCNHILWAFHLPLYSWEQSVLVDRLRNILSCGRRWGQHNPWCNFVKPSRTPSGRHTRLWPLHTFDQQVGSNLHC